MFTILHDYCSLIVLLCLFNCLLSVSCVSVYINRVQFTLKASLVTLVGLRPTPLKWLVSQTSAQTDNLHCLKFFFVYTGDDFRCFQKMFHIMSQSVTASYSIRYTIIIVFIGNGTSINNKSCSVIWNHSYCSLLLCIVSVISSLKKKCISPTCEHL